MSTVRWFFGATGFMVDIVNGEGNESQISGPMPTDEMNLQFGFVPATAAAASTATASSAPSFTPMQVEPGVHGVVQTDIYPFTVKADISFTDEGLLTAEWEVRPERISGKGTGKGMGKRITPMRPAPY